MRHVFGLLTTFALATVATGDEKPSARDTVEKWVAAALAGNVEKAGPLADPNTSLSKDKGVKQFQNLLQRASLRIHKVLVSDQSGKAAAVSEGVKIADPKAPNAIFVSFKLKKVGDKWIVKDIDFDEDAKARSKLQQFKEQNPDAKELTAGD